MVKDVLHAKQLERQRHHEDVVRWVAPLNDMKSAGQEDPPGIEELPEQGPAILPEIPKGGVAFFRHGMPINMNTFQNLAALGVAFAARRQDSDVVASVAKRARFLPHTSVKGHGKI